MGATDAQERLIADSQFGGGLTTWAPGTWYIGLSTTTPNDDGTNFTEPTVGGYARVGLVNDTVSWPAATTTSGVTKKTNGVKATFPNPTATWGSISHYGLFTALTGGTPAYTFPLDAPITVRSGNTPVEFDIGQIVLQFD
jgi:hypothetical protein